MSVLDFAADVASRDRVEELFELSLEMSEDSWEENARAVEDSMGLC